MRTCLVPFIISYHIIWKKKSEDHGDPFLRRFRGCELKFSWSVDGTPSPHGRLRGACRVQLWRRFAAGQPVASQGGCQSADACERRA